MTEVRGVSSAHSESRRGLSRAPNFFATCVDLDSAQSISMMPQRLRSLAPAPAMASDGSALRQARQRVALHLARDFVDGRRDRAAVQAHPQPQQRIGEAVALLPRDDEVDVLEPRQIVLGRAGRALQALRDLGERQRLVLGEDLENRLERAVAARAMQAQLVAIAAPRA